MSATCPTSSAIVAVARVVTLFSIGALLVDGLQVRNLPSRRMTSFLSMKAEIAPRKVRIHL